MVVLYDSLQLAHKCILNSFYGYVMRKVRPQECNCFSECHVEHTQGIESMPDRSWSPMDLMPTWLYTHCRGRDGTPWRWRGL